MRSASTFRSMVWIIATTTLPRGVQRRPCRTRTSLAARASPPLSREGLLPRRVDAEAPVEKSQVEKAPETRVRADDDQHAPGAARALRGAMQDIEDIGVGAVSGAELDDESRVTEHERSLHAAPQLGGVARLRAPDEQRRARGTSLHLVEVDHPRGIPARRPVE